jgi:hypothetical protein
MSNPVLFPVAMCSPVRPFPSCPFSPLPQAYTVNRRQPPIQALDKKRSSRALSVHSEEECECNASRGSNDVLLFASLRVKRPVHELECVNFWAGRVSALLYLPAVNGVWATVKTTAPVQENLTPRSTRVHCCRREQNDFVHWQRSRTQCPGVHQGLARAANGAHSPRSHQRRERQAPQVDCDRRAMPYPRCRGQLYDNRRMRRER